MTTFRVSEAPPLHPFLEILQCNGRQLAVFLGRAYTSAPATTRRMTEGPIIGREADTPAWILEHLLTRSAVLKVAVPDRRT